MKRSQWIVALIYIFKFVTAYADDQIVLHTSASHSQLVLRIDESVSLEFKNSSQGFELFIKNVSVADLGAPVGEEKDWIKQFEQLTDSRLKNLKITDSSGGIQIHGIWKIPADAKKKDPTLAPPQMEVFDYREKLPSRYVIDFWFKERVPASDLQATLRKKQLAKAEKQAKENTEQRKKDYEFANERRFLEIENPKLLCSRPLLEDQDVFMEFYPLHQTFKFNEWLPTHFPDMHFQYTSVTGKDRDAAYAKLALEFFKTGKLALSLRTLDFLNAEFPHSPYRTEMKFLRANALVRLGMQAESEKILNELIEEGKGSSIGLQSVLYLTQKLIASNSTLASLEKFVWLSHAYPKHPLNWLFHLGAAECLYTLKQTERAAKEYQVVIENSQDSRIKAEAASRIGDLFLSRFQYEQALVAYVRNENNVTIESKRFPTFYLNKAETLYQLGQFPKAKEAFKKFLNDYPGHPNGWRATLRLGEIALQGAPDLIEGKKWIYETINQYPFSPGATLARLRLIQCDDHAGFQFATAERFFSEDAKKFDGNGEVVMKNFADFRALAHIRTLISLGTKQQIVDAGIAEYRASRLGFVKRQIALTTYHQFQKLILELLAEGKNYEALQFYQLQASKIPTLEEAVSNEFLLKLSGAANSLGLVQLSKDLITRYQKQGWDPVQTEYEKSFNEAKALWIEQGRKETPKGLEQIKNLLQKVDASSSFSFEKEVILALIDESQSQYKSALVHVSKAQLLHPTKQEIKKSKKNFEHSYSHVDLIFDTWAARLATKDGNTRLALKKYRRTVSALLEEQIESGSDPHWMEELGVPGVPSLESIILSESEILEKQGRWGELVSVFGKVVEKGIGGNQIIFQYARSIQKEGIPRKQPKAIEALKKIAGAPLKAGEDSFWKRMAEETLANNEGLDMTKNAMEGK